MTDNTERLARKWAEYIKSETSLIRTQEVHAAAEYILATTTPPTMADVEWGPEHYLAGATTPEGLEVVMMWHDEHTDNIITDEGAIPRDRLISNGKGYNLREIKEPEHPETLTMAEDYENAPAGTIVAENGDSPYIKRGLGDWADRFGDKRSNEGMSGISRKVLRWGGTHDLLLT